MPFLFSENSLKSNLLLWEMSEEIDRFQNLIELSVYKDIIENTKLDKRKLEKLSQATLLKKAGIEYDMLYYSSSGKPQLKNGKHLSFSHSEELSSLLIDENKCGLDLEYPSDKILRISPKFINQSEKIMMEDSENLYWTWSIKEAIFKYFGERVLFKEHIQVLEIASTSNNATVLYDGFHGKGIFEMKLLRVKKYYLAYTKSYTPE